MKYIIVDLEMNSVNKKYKEERDICNMEIIEIGAVVMDESLLVIGEFKTFVKPQFSDVIYKKYENLTGINTQMVCHAPTFVTAYEHFVDGCESYEDDYEIYSWSDTDYNQIVAEMALKGYNNEEKKEPLKHWFDFQKEYTEKLGLERIMSLDKALDYAGLPFEGRMHDALCDAKNTAELFSIIRDEEKCKATLNAVMEALRPKNVSETLGDRFDFSAIMSKLA